jgi:hypothetical protein
MGSKTARSVFAASLCAGVAMIGVSVNGMLGVDAELQRSAFAAQQRTVDQVHSVRFSYGTGGGDCPAPAAAPRVSDQI